METLPQQPESRMQTEPFLKVRGLRKQFGSTQALKGVEVDVCSGEVHGLVGANGAGKSTLIRILAGIYTADAGAIFINGSEVQIRNPQDSSRLGLGFIHQELNLVAKFDAVQNMTLGLSKPSHFGLIDWRSVKREVDVVAERLGIGFPLDVPVEDLSVAERWMVSIGRSLVRRARLIAMDEPTASLSSEEADRLFRVIRELSADGISILYVSHRLDEILQMCDRTTVFRDGEVASTIEAGTATKDTLITAIVGHEVNPLGLAEGGQAVDKPVVLEVRGLRREPLVHDVSFSVHAGEIVGLGGLVGSGRTEVARLIFGADRSTAGEILLDGRVVRTREPHDAVQLGIGLIPEERRSEGLILDKGVAFNTNLPSLGSLRLVSWLPLISLRRGSRRAANIAGRLQVKARSMATEVRALSGGNQQKVVIGKWLTRDSRVLILDEPSRGVDVGARAEIHQVIRDLAAGGVAIIVISSEEEEIAALCNRVVLMAEGRVVGELVGHEITREAIIHLSYSDGTERGAAS